LSLHFLSWWDRRTCALIAGACLGVAAGAARAQAPAEAPHDSIVISILTMGPGEEVFERFGHQSIRIHDLTTGLDSAYNWGMFSFEQPHFLVRFLTGDTKYWMQGFPSTWLVSVYRDSGRAVWEQELSLTRTEKDSLWRYIKWNAKEENKWYRYDYYRDNCGTRVRDALNMVLGGSIERAVAAREHGVTYRSETLRLARAYPLINFGMDFVLGRPADDTLSAWAEMFVPMRLQQLIRSIRVRHSDGTVGRLVRSERQLVVDERYKDADTPPGYLAPAVEAGFAISGVLLALCLLPVATTSTRWAVGIIGTTLLISTSVNGLILAAPLFVYGIGVGFATAQLTSIVLSDVPVDRSGIASGANSTLRQVGSALGIAVLGTVLFSTLVSASSDNVTATLPGVSPACVQLVARLVDDSAGQVLSALRHPAQAAAADFGASSGALPPEQIACFRDPAFIAALPQTVKPIEDAFVAATRFTGFVAAGFVLLGFVFSLLLPGRRPQPVSAPPGPEAEAT